MRYLDYTGLGYLVEELKVIFIQEQSGKGLTSNDFSDILREKLEGIETGAQVNTVNSVNGKVGKVIIDSEDIKFLSSVSGASETTVKLAIDKIISDMNTNKSNIENMKRDKADVTYVDTMLDGKVDAVDGVGLSDNNFTDLLKTKLDSIESGAQVNKIELIRRNGANLDITSKGVNIDVPTKVSELTNDKDYQTVSEVLSLVKDIGRTKKKVVAELPSVLQADDNTMYLIVNSNGSGYEEWIVIEGAWEKLGDTSHINLEDYLGKDEVSSITNAEIDAFLKV